MRLYLSSYKLGHEVEALRREGETTAAPVGYIPNALDFTAADPVRKQQHTTHEMAELRGLGFTVELFDLGTYFGKTHDLYEHCEAWVASTSVAGIASCCGGPCS